MQEHYSLIVDTHAGHGMYPNPTHDDFIRFLGTEDQWHHPLTAYRDVVAKAQSKAGIAEGYPGSPLIALFGTTAHSRKGDTLLAVDIAADAVGALTNCFSTIESGVYRHGDTRSLTTEEGVDGREALSRKCRVLQGDGFEQAPLALQEHGRVVVTGAPPSHNWLF